MSRIVYNGVELPYPFITSFSQEAVADDSGTDLVYTKFDITTQFVVNPKYMALMAPDLVDHGTPLVSNPAGIMDNIRQRLLRRRRTLSVTFNGNELIPQAAGVPGTVDAKNGPVPQYCNISQLTNTTFLCNYKIVAHYVDNPLFTMNNNGTPNQPGNNTINNRWSESVEINSLQESRRTREGKVVIRSDNKDGVIADQVRSAMAVVGIAHRCIRDHARYTLSPDGLTLSYQIVDKEVWKTPPFPAYEASGHYREISSSQGAKRWGEVKVHLKGTTDEAFGTQDKLIALAIQIGLTKLRVRGNQLFANPTAPKATWNLLESAEVCIQLYRNEVEFHARAFGTMEGEQQIFKSISMFGGMDTTTYNSPQIDKGGTIPTYLDRGTAGILLQAAAYYDPTIKDTQIGASVLTTADADKEVKLASEQSQLTKGTLVGQAGTNKEP